MREVFYCTKADFVMIAILWHNDMQDSRRILRCRDSEKPSETDKTGMVCIYSDGFEHT